MDIKKVGSLHSRVTPFQYFCQGESHSSKLLLRQGNVNKQVADVCKPRPKEIRIAFNQDWGIWVENDKMVLQDTDQDCLTGFCYYEILSTFFTSHNLNPTWHDADGSFNFYDEDTGLWTSLIGLVSLARENFD